MHTYISGTVYIILMSTDHWLTEFCVT